MTIFLFNARLVSRPQNALITGLGDLILDGIEGPVPTPRIDTHYTASLVNQPERRRLRHAATGREILRSDPELIHSRLIRQYPTA